MKERIRMVREKSGLNLTKFAESLNTSVAAISRYESGDRIPSDAILKLISNEFSVSYSWLKTGEGPMDDPSPDRGTLDKLTDVYTDLPERVKMLVDVLVDMDPEWWKTLDDAFAELERRRKEKEGDAD